MRRLYFYILTLILGITFFFQNGLAQDYVHDKTLTGHTLDIESVAFSPDGQTLASGSHGNIRLWDVATGTP